MLAVIREVQVPMLAVLLFGGCAAKARHAIGVRQGSGPTAMVPLRLRRPATFALCATEFALGAALLLTAGRAGAGNPASAARAATALLLGTAAAALHELRARRPDAGCGCFGELSRTPVSWRVIARATLLCGAALSSIGIPPLRMPDSATQAWLTLAAVAAELVVLVALSPEIGQAMLRLSHADPCELREVPVWRTLSALHTSAHGCATSDSSSPPRRSTSGGRVAGVSWSFPACWPAAAWTWSSPSTWPAAAPRSAWACWTRAPTSCRPWRRPSRTRYRNLTAYWKNPIQENKADNPPNDFSCLWRRTKSHAGRCVKRQPPEAAGGRRCGAGALLPGEWEGSIRRAGTEEFTEVGTVNAIRPRSEL